MACVRRKAVESLPLLRLWVRFPKDAEVISKLIAAATAATEDNNDGVRTAANRVLEDLEKVRCPVRWLPPPPLCSLRGWC